MILRNVWHLLPRKLRVNVPQKRVNHQQHCMVSQPRTLQRTVLPLYKPQTSSNVCLSTKIPQRRVRYRRTLKRWTRSANRDLHVQASVGGETDHARCYTQGNAKQEAVFQISSSHGGEYEVRQFWTSRSSVHCRWTAMTQRSLCLDPLTYQ
jgi:hypothetical protein